MVRETKGDTLRIIKAAESAYRGYRHHLDD